MKVIFMIRMVSYSHVFPPLFPNVYVLIPSHYAFYLRDGMSVLELGAAENSYIPEGVKLSRHVGVGLSQKLMEKNPSLSENMVVDLNTVIEKKGVDSDELLNLGSDSFDAILMANTLEYLTNPREVFRYVGPFIIL